MSKAPDAPASARPAPGVLAWRNSVLTIFIVNGLSLASWISRIPGVRDNLNLSTADVGALLLCMSIGAICGLVAAPIVLARLGGRRGIGCGILLMSISLATVGFGASVVHSVPLVAVGLALAGLANGATDVTMNVEAAAAERAVGKTTLPLMHAGFSLGTVFGAGLGALAAALNVPVFVHLVVIGIVVICAALAALRFFPEGIDLTPDSPPRKRPVVRRTLGERVKGSLAVWADVTLVFIGLVLLGMAFTEGSANDWLALAVVDGHHQSNSIGALVFGVFVLAMTVGRLVGGPLVDRIGRVAANRWTAGLGVIGLLMFILGGPMWVVVVGTVLWGIGASLGFPLGMSAAAQGSEHPAARVSAVAMIGYCAFLVGPPLMGFLGQQFGLLNALYLVLALLLLSAVFAGALRPKPTVEEPGSATPTPTPSPAPAPEPSPTPAP